MAEVMRQQGLDDGIACIIYDELMYFTEAAAKNLKLPSIILCTGCAANSLARIALTQLKQQGPIPFPGIYVRHSTWKRKVKTKRKNTLLMLHKNYVRSYYLMIIYSPYTIQDYKNYVLTIIIIFFFYITEFQSSQDLELYPLRFKDLPILENLENFLQLVSKASNNKTPSAIIYKTVHWTVLKIHHWQKSEAVSNSNLSNRSNSRFCFYLLK